MPMQMLHHPVTRIKDVEHSEDMPIADTLKTVFLTLISLNPRSSDFKDSLIIFKLRAKQIAPFRNKKRVKKDGSYSTCKFNEHVPTITHTSSPSPFARKSNVDNVVLYFKQSAMNSAPDTPICRIYNSAEDARLKNT